MNTTRSVTTTPQVNRSTTGTSTGVSTSSGSDSGTKVNRGATTRSSSDRGGTALPSTNTNHLDNVKPTTVDKNLKSERSSVGSSITDNRSKDNNGKPGGNVKPGGNDKGGSGKPGGTDKGGNGKPGGIDKGGNDKGGNGKPGGIDRGGNGRGNDGNRDRNGNRGNNGNRGRNGSHGYNPDNRFDYSNHHYRDDFHRNYTNHSWSWSRPLPPPVRAYRPVLREWYRPVVPYGWHPYTGAPIIDRILGITFGTLFDTSIEFLYYNGYEIDGYADHVIYLRDVALINHLWDDVMLCYDSNDRLVNAQFVYHSSSINRHRYNRIYNSLCRVYGSPITSDSRGISWFGGGCNGWITLSNYEDIGHYYMTLSIGF